jgi:hypothetical protein
MNNQKLHVAIKATGLVLLVSAAIRQTIHAAQRQSRQI